MTCRIVPLMRAAGLSFAVADAHREVRRAAAHRHPPAGRTRRGARGVRSPAGAARAPEAAAMIYRILVLLALLALIIGVVLLSAPQRESSAPAAARVGPPHDPGYSAREAQPHADRSRRNAHLHRSMPARSSSSPTEGWWSLTQVQTRAFAIRAATRGRRAPQRGELAQRRGIVKLDGDVHVCGHPARHRRAGTDHRASTSPSTPPRRS